MTSNNKISAHQTLIMYMLAMLPPMTRLFPAAGAKFGGRAGWLAPIVGVLPVLVVLACLAAIFKKQTDGPRDLFDAYARAFGSIPARIIGLAHLVWIGLLYMLYLRYYAERLLSTIFVTTDIRFFLIIMCALVFIAIRGRLETFARFTDFMLIIFAVVFSVLLILLTPSFKLGNVFPVTHLDTKNVLRAALPALAVFIYMPFLFFFGGHIADKENALKKGRKFVIIIGATSSVMLLFVLASLGARTVSRMPTPFFNATKLINILEPFDRLETLLLSAWVVSDFILISLFAIILTHLLKHIFKTRETKRFAAPVTLLGFAGGIYFAVSRTEMEIFSASNKVYAVNIALGFALPLLALTVGKLRRRW